MPLAPGGALYFDTTNHSLMQNNGDGTGADPYNSQNTTYTEAPRAPYVDPAIAAQAAATARQQADTSAYYQDSINQLNGQNGRLDGQLNTGLSNLTNSYNTQSNRLNESKAIAQRNFNDQSQQNMTGYSNARTGIMNNTRQTANALQRLLGLNGAGSSSAALEQAPYAAGLQGSQNINEAQQNYSRNTTNLKNKWDDTENQFKNSFQDLNQQKTEKENSLRSSIQETRANILTKIRDANIQKDIAGGKNYQQARDGQSSFQNQINSLLDQMTGLGNQYANPVMKAADVNFQAPELGTFSLGDQAQVSNQPGAGAGYDPTFLSLLGQGQRDKERNNFLGY